MAFFQETRPSREPFLNAPAAVLWLIGVMVAAHIARVAGPALWRESILVTYAFVPARYAAAAPGMMPPDLFAKAVPFVSYMFLHADFAHIAINMLWLLAFGPAVARRLGTLKFLIFFFACGIAAAGAHLAANWGSPVPVVGASGGISGLMGGAIRILYGHRAMVVEHEHVVTEHRVLAPILSRPVLIFSAMWILVNVIAGVTGVGTGADYALVAWMAHLGGFFAGLILIGVLEALPPRRKTA